MTGRRRATAAVSLAVAATIALAGCAAIPTSGPVQRGDQVQGTEEQPPVRVLPRGPVSGQSPAAVVRGFLDASASFVDDHEVARRFLTPRASDRWNPDARVTVLDDNPRATLAEKGGLVRLTARQTASITGDGALLPRGGSRFEQDFPMRRVGEEWRIARAPQGLILDRIEASLAYRSFDRYFVNGTRTFLVPDPVYLPVEPTGSATSLVKGLLRGPTRWLRPAVESLIPAGTELVVDSVPVENGVAQVDLSAEFLDAEQDALALASAQITATLLELSSSVSGVSITVEGSPLDLPDQPAVFTADTWEAYETSALSPALGLVFTRNGGVRHLDQEALTTGSHLSEPVLGALGSGQRAVRDPSQSWNGQTVTALNRARTRLLVTHPGVRPGVADTVTGRRLLPATIDGDGRLWSIDVGAARPRLRYLEGSNWFTAKLRAPRGAITSLRVSPDGTRMAMVLTRGERAGASGVLLVGRVVAAGETLRVEAFRRIERTLSDIGDAFWSDATTVAAVATTGRAPEPMLVNIDRTVTPLSTDVLVSVNGLVGAPSLPLVADTPRDGLWQSDGAAWQSLVEGHDPAYPG
jgi:hypothetical protein